MSGTGSIYFLRDQLGRGIFGKVSKVVDVSTGYQYAAKFFYHSECDRELAIMKEVKHVSILQSVLIRVLSKFIGQHTLFNFA